MLNVSKNIVGEFLHSPCGDMNLKKKLSKIASVVWHRYYSSFHLNTNFPITFQISPYIDILLHGIDTLWYVVIGICYFLTHSLAFYRLSIRDRFITYSIGLAPHMPYSSMWKTRWYWGIDNCLWYHAMRCQNVIHLKRIQVKPYLFCCRSACG